MNEVILEIKITIHYSFATIEKIYPYSLVNLMNKGNPLCGHSI
jgi:hypothetical protein